MNVLCLLAGILFGSLAMLFLVTEVERRKIKTLMQLPSSTLIAPPETSPPEPGYIPFELWPPSTGWHRVLVTREPHDGDTVQIGLVVVVTGHLAKIDAPDLALVEGKAAQQALANQLTVGQMYTVWLYGRDKYGRTLAEFYNTKGESINKWMVANGFAQPYAG